MVKKTSKSARRMKDTNSQKRRKKRLAHFGGKEQPMTFGHAAINEGWDMRRTLKQNYAAMGLATDPNAAMPIKKTDVQRQAEQADKEVTLKSMAVMKELDAVANLPKPEPYQVRSMSIAEQKRIALLLQKHGDDYAAMFRDRQVNTMQETEAVLKKRVALYKRLQSL